MVNKTDTLVACIDELAPRYVIGTDPFDVERLAWNIQRAEYGRPGEVSQSALASFDVACWDLMGQSLGVPVWKLLGGHFRDRVPAYANGWYQAERDPQAIARLARGVVERGYRGAEARSVRRGQRRAVRARAPPRRGHRGRGARGRRTRRADHGRDARALHAGDGGRGGGPARALRSGMDRGAGAAGERGRPAPACARPRICPSPPASARTPIEDIRPFIEQGSSTSSRWTSRTSAGSCR